MLIHIHSSAVDDALGSGSSADRSRDTIELLLQMHHQGHHVVYLDPDDGRKLQSIRSRLSRRAGRAFEFISQKALEIASLRNRLRWHLQLGLGDWFDGREHPRPEGGYVIRASLHHFDQPTRAARSVLMAENLTDISFYMELARVLVVAHGRRGITVECDRMPGGGSTFAPLFEHLADEGRILLAIADSDRKRPDGPPGETWRELSKKQTKDGQDRPKFQRARAVHGREAENLVPLDVYEAVFRRMSEREPRVPILRDLRRLNDDCLAHADLKEGITLYQIERVMEPRAREFWSDVSAALGRDRCQRPHAKCQKRDECSCYVLEGFGSYVLDQVVKWLRQEGRRNPPEVARLFELSGDGKLVEICDEVTAWGCAFAEKLS